MEGHRVAQIVRRNERLRRLKEWKREQAKAGPPPDRPKRGSRVEICANFVLAAASLAVLIC